MRNPTPRGILAASVVIALSLTVTACGGDGGDDDAAVARTTVVTTESTIPGQPSTTLPTGEEICTKVPAEVVDSNLDIEVSEVTPSNPNLDQAPTCTYVFTDEDGKTAVVTLAALRPLDMQGKTGAEGYKVFVAANKAFAEGIEYEEVPVEVGRESVRFTASATHTAISDTGKHVVQLTVPNPTADADQVDALLKAVVAAIG